MRKLIEALKEALNHPQEDIQRTAADSIVTVINTNFNYLMSRGLFLNDASFSVLDAHAKVFSNSKSIAHYQKLQTEADAMAAPLQNLEVVLKNCLQKKNFPQFEKLLEIILIVEKNYNRHNMTVLSFLNLFNQVVEARGPIEFLALVLEKLSPELMLLNPKYKEDAITAILSRTKSGEMHPEDVATIAQLLDAGADPLYHLDDRGTLFDQLMAIYANAAPKKMETIDQLCLGLIEQSLAAGVWDDSCYAAMWYCVRTIMMRPDADAAMALLPKLIQLRQQTPLRSCTPRYYYYRPVAVNDDDPLDEIRGTEYTGLYVGNMLLGVTKGFPVPVNQDDDAVNIRIRSLEQAFLPIVEMYATLNMMEGVEFARTVYRGALTNSILRENTGHLTALLQRGAGYNRILEHVSEALLLNNDAKAFAVLDLLITAHIEFDRRPLKEFAPTLIDLEVRLRPNPVVDGEKIETPPAYAARLFYFYERLLAARGIDDSIEPNLGFLFLGGTDLDYDKSLEEQVKKIKFYTQLNLDYHKYAFDDPSLVKALLPYFQWTLILSAVKSRMEDLVQRIFSVAKSPRYSAEEQAKYFTLTHQQRARLEVLSALNSILYGLTSRSLFFGKGSPMTQEFSEMIMSDDQNVRQQETKSILHLFFAELIRRMEDPKQKFVVDLKLWVGLKEGYIKEANPLLFKSTIPVVAMLNAFVHPSEKVSVAVKPASVEVVPVVVLAPPPSVEESLGHTVASPIAGLPAAMAPAEANVENPFAGGQFFAKDKKSKLEGAMVEMNDIKPKGPSPNRTQRASILNPDLELIDPEEQDEVNRPQ